jgi:hypothetical protein
MDGVYMQLTSKDSPFLLEYRPPPQSRDIGTYGKRSRKKENVITQESHCAALTGIWPKLMPAAPCT